MPTITEMLVLGLAAAYLAFSVRALGGWNRIASARLVAVVGFLLVAHFTLGFWTTSDRVSKGWADASDLPEIMLLYLAMVAGMLSQHLYGWLTATRRSRFRIRPFLAPMFVAPIVFIPFYNAVKDNWHDGGVRWTLILVAYENGFFFKNTLHTRETHRGTTE